MQVFFVYKALAHPEGGSNSYVTPFNLKERLLHVKEAEKTLGATIPWLCDTMDNDLKHALGDRPNSEFVLDPDGKIVVMRDWSRPDTLRADLERLVGPIENPTRISDLDLKIETTPKPAASGVVKRTSLPGQGQPLVVIPEESSRPFYVKLRAEADQNLLRTGRGQLYLGFHLDPIYHVHWNNLAKPLSWEANLPDGASMTPDAGTGPKVDAESDIDPREFVVDVKAERLSEPIEVTVKYFACNDEEGFCIPVTQKYSVELKQDRDGGRANRSGSRRPPGGGQPRPGGGRPGGGFSVERFMQFDRNRDGKVSRQEMPPQMQRMLDRADSNKDGAIDRNEAKQIEERMRRRFR